jgi:hypothetical protein
MIAMGKELAALKKANADVLKKKKGKTTISTTDFSDLPPTSTMDEGHVLSETK